MSFTDNWSDEEFIRQMKDLIGNEGDIHVTCNHSEGEQVTETHVHAESSLVLCWNYWMNWKQQKSALQNWKRGKYCSRNVAACFIEQIFTMITKR